MRLSDKLIKYSSFTDPNECWTWEGGVKDNGYGSLWWKKASHSVHRTAWMVSVGAIEFGHQLDHLCKNKLCFNPDHLEVVDATTNIRRGKGWVLEDGQWYCPKKHLVSGWNLVTRRDGSVRCRNCTNEDSNRRRRKS